MKTPRSIFHQPNQLIGDQIDPIIPCLHVVKDASVVCLFLEAAATSKQTTHTSLAWLCSSPWSGHVCERCYVTYSCPDTTWLLLCPSHMGLSTLLIPTLHIASYTVIAYWSFIFPTNFWQSRYQIHGWYI